MYGAIHWEVCQILPCLKVSQNQQARACQASQFPNWEDSFKMSSHRHWRATTRICRLKAHPNSDWPGFPLLNCSKLPSTESAKVWQALKHHWIGTFGILTYPAVFWPRITIHIDLLAQAMPDICDPKRNHDNLSSRSQRYNGPLASNAQISHFLRLPRQQRFIKKVTDDHVRS